METRLLIFKNDDPTPVEKKLFHYAGYYLAEKNYLEDDAQKTNEPGYIRYVCLHPDKTNVFLNEINISYSYVDYEQTIEFFCNSHTLKIKGMIDDTILGLINERIIELGWN